MNLYIGIDLGTSSLKGIVVDSVGNILRQSVADYDVYYPQDGWSEQNPKDWLKSLDKVMVELTQGISQDIKGISFGGQMHGLVVLDECDDVIRNCILWNDGRTDKETEYLNEVIGKDKLSSLTANIAFAGFTAPKILWLRNNEADNFKRISKIMLPKDYLSYYLSGVFATDYSDASGTLLLDVEHKVWSEEMCRICGISRDTLPTLYESYDVVGCIREEIADKYNLPRDTKVIIGAGDNAAAAIGTATVHDGDCNISLGTSGTVFVSQDKFGVDKANALHSFAHANGKWHLMGCILSAASCNKWWIEDILKSNDYSASAVAREGESGVYFLPYIMGERSPHNDTFATGCFVGLRPNTTREEMSLAILEGVTFAIRDCVEIAREGGINISRTNLCGGGAKSETWRQLVADILNVEVSMTATEQGPSLGASILAMVGAGEYRDIVDATSHIVNSNVVAVPDKQMVERYNEKYAKWKQIYPALKACFKVL